ncbi:MAG TPA: glycosyltransferase [Firmicutes bacterium]|nr:glycosyltransferase [Bacillota bacterium]
MKGIQVIMICPSWGRKCGIAEYSKALVDELTAMGANVSVLPGNIWETSLSPGVARGAVTHFQFEYALYNPWTLSPVVRKLAAVGARFVFTVHDFHPAPSEHNMLLRGMPCYMIVHSEKTREALLSLGIPLSRISVIPMGARDYDPGDRRATRVKLGLQEHDKVVGFFGFALAQKGIVQLAEATKLLQGSYPGLKLFLFSTSPFFDEFAGVYLRSALAERRLLANVVIVDEYLPVDQVVKYLHAMDVIALPYGDSGFIGTSAAARVAMAARRPIITTDIPYFSDLKDEVFKIASQDPAEIARAVERVMQDSELVQRLIAACERYLRVNSWHAVAVKHMDLYRRISCSVPRSSESNSYQNVPANGRDIAPGVPEWAWQRVIERFGKAGVKK